MKGIEDDEKSGEVDQIKDKFNSKDVLLGVAAAKGNHKDYLNKSDGF